MPRKGSSGGGGGGGGRTYVNNSANRSLGRVGMSVGSAPVSRVSSGSSSYSGGSSRTYVDNSMNRNLGRVGMTLGSASVSAGSSSNSASTSRSSRTYVDNAMNRNLGRVGMTLGSASVSAGSSSNSASTSSSSRTYVDNAMNRNLGRVGMTLGSASVSKTSSGSSSHSNGSDRTYVDNSMNRKLGRVGETLGSKPVSSSSGHRMEQKTYVDNAFNRTVNRVGLPIGSKPVSSKNDVKCYVDNYLNRKYGRVGKPLGSMQVSSKNKQNQQLMKEAFERYQQEDDDGYFDDNYKDYDPDFFQTLQEQVERNNIWEIEEARKRVEYLEQQQQSRYEESYDSSNKKSFNDYIGAVILFEDLDISDKKLGHGGFGDIHAAKWNDKLVAVKKLRVQRVSRKRLRQFEEEVTIFGKLNHENIVKFYGACIKTPNLCMVMELMQASLYDKLHIDQYQFTDENKLHLSNEIAKGLEYLHSVNIAHCDIKSKNVLLDIFGNDKIYVKITDFGLSLMKNDLESTTSSLSSSSTSSQTVVGIGTPRYSAPEVLRGDVLTRSQMIMTDIYSYGLVVYEIYSEEEPFDDLNIHQLRKQIGEGNRIPPVDSFENAPQVFTSLVTSCWKRDPQNRPKMSTICQILESYIDITKRN